MERGSTKHSPRVDEAMEYEVRGVVQGTAGGRVEEWKMAEPAGEDQPDPTLVPGGDYGRGVPDGVGNPDAEEFSRFGSYIGLSALPGDREALSASAVTLGAPDDVLAALDRLPAGETFHTVTEIWTALGNHT